MGTGLRAHAVAMRLTPAGKILGAALAVLAVGLVAVGLLLRRIEHLEHQVSQLSKGQAQLRAEQAVEFDQDKLTSELYVKLGACAFVLLSPAPLTIGRRQSGARAKISVLRPHRCAHPAHAEPAPAHVS